MSELHQSAGPSRFHEFIDDGSLDLVAVKNIHKVPCKYSTGKIFVELKRHTALRKFGKILMNAQISNFYPFDVRKLSVDDFGRVLSGTDCFTFFLNR